MTPLLYCIVLYCIVFYIIVIPFIYTFKNDLKQQCIINTHTNNDNTDMILNNSVLLIHTLTMITLI